MGPEDNPEEDMWAGMLGAVEEMDERLRKEIAQDRNTLSTLRWAAAMGVVISILCALMPQVTLWPHPMTWVTLFFAFVYWVWGIAWRRRIESKQRALGDTQR